ncbi:ABC transporter ATP-binding protein [Parafrankia sp. BMG5.11]|uniref:ABC transporter ATP-binding protein n=1 Tax=Parafrankia sp. BMG5.11 TaxID=222540 RepID=UPI0010392E74|nr:ATP-binding cassette domain-containing protein [Parafrankia sp. BMG5.11]
MTPEGNPLDGSPLENIAPLENISPVDSTPPTGSMPPTGSASQVGSAPQAGSVSAFRSTIPAGTLVDLTVPERPLLDVRDAEVAYGAVTALRGISLRVDPGEVVALLGANGAGKTTTLRMISGLLPPARGSVWFDGARLAGTGSGTGLGGTGTGGGTSGNCGAGAWSDGTRDSPGLPVHRVAALGISHVPEGRRIFPAMTVAENLAMGAYTDRRRAWSRAGRDARREARRDVRRGLDRVHALFPRLAERDRQPAGTLSGGEQQMLAIGRALMARPRLVLLDEPSLGLAPKLVATIFEVIEEINADGVTVLLVEQNAAAALRIAHRGYVLDTGQVALAGSADELARDPRVRDAYLGSPSDSDAVAP